MRGVRRAWLATGAVIAAAVAIGALTASDEARPATHRQTYLQYNLCGNACNSGGLGIVTDVERSIRQAGPFAVILNELCENQYAELEAGLALYAGRFDPTGPRCRNGAPYGNAILARVTEVDLVGSWLLPSPVRDETRRLMCLQTPEEAASVVVCVTHLSNEDGNVGPQVQAVAEILNGLPDQPTIVLGGDFNVDPADPRMDPLYSACYRTGTGRFREADSPGCASRATLNRRHGSDVINEHTYGQHKFDYVFLSEGRWSTPEADVARSPNGRSDHAALWATVALTEPRPPRTLSSTR
ncbi:MAG: endonuclease/exonuclease/phosphatase family protein [Micromonosporaceae bacterium]